MWGGGWLALFLVQFPVGLLTEFAAFMSGRELVCTTLYPHNMYNMPKYGWKVLQSKMTNVIMLLSQIID